MKPYWYPDWTGQTCAIIASGPSIKHLDLEPIREKGIRCTAINNNYLKAPWADVLYACDVGWWRNHPAALKFNGLKITQDKLAQDEFGIHRVICERHHENLVIDRPGFVGWGGNSGFHSINLNVQWHVKKIILVGFDMHLDDGTHWHGDHLIPGMNNPTPANVKRWRNTIDANAPKLKELGIEVINTSMTSALTQFKKMSLLEALND